MPIRTHSRRNVHTDAHTHAKARIHTQIHPHGRRCIHADTHMRMATHTHAYEYSAASWQVAGSEPGAVHTSMGLTHKCM